MDDKASKSPLNKENKQQVNDIHLFIHWDRESQLQAFFKWLPRELHNAPGVDWNRLPPKVMGYCIRTIRDSPDAAHIAIAIVSAVDAHTPYSLKHLASELNGFFKILRLECGMNHIQNLYEKEVWTRFATNKQCTPGILKNIISYTSVEKTHYPLYLQQLTHTERLYMQTYSFPPIPQEMLKRKFPSALVRNEAEQRRKAQSDILIPLYPVLRQLVRFRKRAVERMLQTIREARRLVESGDVSLPYAFEHIDTIPVINRTARTVAEIEIQGREVLMHFVLWDKRSWILDHPDRVTDDIVYNAKARRDSYKEELNRFFVQFIGPTSDLLWFGELIERRLIQNFKVNTHQEEGYLERWKLARSLGFSIGCQCSRPGLLSTSDRWFSDSMHRDGDCVFEPEALYRGVLYGATLAIMALSNGSRVSELLQVSCNKERRITRTELVVILGDDGQPVLNKEGIPLTKQVKIHLQHLLPKGAKTDEERQLFPLSKESMRLFSEIKQLLEETHGEVPVIQPSRNNAKYECLKPEQYLFQWAANINAEGAINILDVQVLLRFIFHDLNLYTMQGKPIQVSTHLLRHVMATHARQYRHIPKEAIAHFFLHHQKALSERSLSLSEVSEYYFQMTEEQRLEIICNDIDKQEEIDSTAISSQSFQRNLEQMNEDMRIVYEQWQTLHPTAFGYCGCPGLCPREYKRSLCVGCSYLVTDPEMIGGAIAWRKSHAKQAKFLEAQGNYIDARQVHFKVKQLDDLINIMRIQQQAEIDGSYIPFFKLFPESIQHKDK